MATHVGCRTTSCREKAAATYRSTPRIALHGITPLRLPPGGSGGSSLLRDQTERVSRLQPKGIATEPLSRRRGEDPRRGWSADLEPATQVPSEIRGKASDDIQDPDCGQFSPSAELVDGGGRNAKLKRYLPDR